MTGEERRKAMLKQRGGSDRDEDAERLQKRKAILEQTQKRLKKQKRIRQLKKMAVPAAAVLLLVVAAVLVKNCGGGKKTPEDRAIARTVEDPGTHSTDTAEKDLKDAEGEAEAEQTKEEAVSGENSQAEGEPGKTDGSSPEGEKTEKTDNLSDTGIRVNRIPVEMPTPDPNATQAPPTYEVYEVNVETRAPEAGPEAPAGPYIDPSGIVMPSWITQCFIHINPVSRPAIALDSVDYIVIHYVGNPGSTAMGNREYFDSLDNPNVEGAGRQASAQLIVGLEGEVIQCLPLNEVAYATGVADLNRRTISIEVCHPDWEGKFSDVTYRSLVKLTAWLLQQEGLTPDRLLRHHDCSGKLCPIYYVEHPEAWEQLKADIAEYYYSHPNIQ